MDLQAKVSKEISHGLDREELGTYSPSEDYVQGAALSALTQADRTEKEDIVGTDEAHSPNKLHRLTDKIQGKFQSKLRGDLGSSHDQRRFDATTLAPTLAPSSRTTQNDRLSGDMPEKPSKPPFKEYVTKPIGTIKSLIHAKGGSEFADNVADAEVSHGANVGFVLAHEKIAASSTKEERLTAVQDFEKLKKARQDSLVRWTMDRHIRKVKALPSQVTPWPKKSNFVRNDCGREKMYWLDYGHHLLNFYVQAYGRRYIGASSELPEPTESALISSFERVLLMSMPVQDVLTKLASIAFWEFPTETAAYAGLYFTLCLYNYITRALILYVLYTTLRTRFIAPTIPDLREKLERTEDRNKTAQDLTELIEQHGTHGWVEPLIEKAGPTMQLQLEDLANLMEIIQNFHEWRDPRRTASTLLMLSSMWLMITLAPVWLLVKASFLGIGVAFFVLIPITHRWPQYRLLASPSNWLFWKIPTHGEWAIARLQAQATQHLQKSPPAAPDVDVSDIHITDDSSIGSLEDTHTINDLSPQSNAAHEKALRIGRYHCISEKHHGNLSLNADGIYFETHLTASQRWKLDYAELKSMQKVIGLTKISSGEGILFIDTSKREYQVSALKLRDEVFTQIIGFSQIEWQITG